jgi:tripartite-type tricarboxylate transporter receptor subunit TctC
MQDDEQRSHCQQRRALFALVAGAALPSAQAQTISAAVGYPKGPVRLIVPFPAGSSTDVLGREIAEFYARALGQPVVVENRPGALATLGAAEVARAKPDGYTLLFGTSTSQAAAVGLFKKLPYDPGRDFAPIGRVGAVNFALAVRADFPAKSLQELIEYGRNKQGAPLSWAYANSANRVAGAALVRHGGFESIAVPYKGVPQILMDIIGGQVDFTIADFASVLPQARSGKLRILAVTSPRPVPELPGVPAMADAVTGFSLLGWYGVFATAATPAPIVNLLSDLTQKALTDKDVLKRIETAGLMPYPGSSSELRAYVATEIVKWSDLIRAAKIEAE